MSTLARPAQPVDEDLVAASMPDETGPMWISPEVAELWLTRNTNNRRIREARVNTMARDMALDHWKFTGEAIKFSKEGRLIDGQHRLLAIIKAQTTVKILVVVGLEDDAQAFMDAGARRTTADALTFHGEVHASFLAATIRFAISLERRTSGRETVSTVEQLEWLTNHPEIRRYVGKASRYASKFDAKPSTMGYALWRMFDIDEEEGEYFFSDMVEMRTDGSGDPMYVLLSRMRTARKNREKVSQRVELNWITRTWNARRTGTPMKILKYPADEMEVLKFL